MILKISFRNIFRHKRRSLLTALAMIFGYVLMSISLGIADGAYSNIIDSFTRNKTGHIQIHSEDYLDNPSLYKTLSNLQVLTDILNKTDNVQSFTARIYSGALAFFNDKTMGVSVVGIDPESENRTTNAKVKVKKGSYFSPKGHNVFETIITQTVANVLKIKIGDDLILVTQGADGSIANDLFKVIGINSKEKAHRIYLPIGSAQTFLGLGKRIHEYAVVLEEQTLSQKVAKLLQTTINNPRIDVRPWQEVEKVFYTAMQADLQGNHVFLGIIMFIIAIGILNTVLMSVLERTREYGVLKALGTKPNYIFSMITIEIFLLSIISIFLAIPLAFATNWWFASYGILFDPPIEYGGIQFTKMISTLNVDVFLIPGTVIIVCAIFVSIWPGIRAAKIIPIKALRSL